MFFCKYKIYHIKKRKPIYKKHKLKLISLFILIIFSVLIFFIENNIQSIISNKFSENKSLNLSFEDIDFNLNGNFTIKNFLLSNKDNDSLVYSSKLSLDPITLTKAIFNQKYEFRKIDLKNGFIDLKFFVDSSYVDKKSLSVNDSLIFFNSNFFIDNLNFEKFSIKKNSELILKDLNFYVDKLKFSDKNLELIVEDLNFRYKEYQISKLNSKISFLEETLFLDDFNVKINNSFLNGSFKVNNPVNSSKFEIIGFFENCKIISSDLISNSNSKAFDFQASFNFTNNKIVFKDLKVFDNDNLLNASVVLSNFENNRPKQIEINFYQFNSSSDELQKTFPNIFGSILPSSLKTLGIFKSNGNIVYNNSLIRSSFDLSSKNGKIYSNLELSDFDLIDDAKYLGTIKGSNINLSKIIGLPFLGKSNFDFSISGQGFTKELLNTSIEGNIFNLEINDYQYQNIVASGKVNNKIFDGYLKVNDVNLEMDFSGLVNFTNEIFDFDFSTNIKKSNLDYLKLSNLPNTKLSGTIITKLRGNDINNLIGDISFSNFKYQSDDFEYEFEDLIAQSRINNDRRFFNINSTDAIDGIIIGGLNSFNLINTISYGYLSKYSNFSSIELDDEVSFNLNIKSKIAKVINSEINIDDNTFLNGKISKDNFELNIISPLVSSLNFELENIDFSFKDNIGKLEINEIKSEFFSGKNLIMNSEFKNDKTYFEIAYDSDVLNVFKFDHTISKDLKSIFTLNDLTINYNDNIWSLDSSTGDNKNKFVYGKEYRELKPVKLISGSQILEFRFFDDNIDFNFNSSFNNVNFESIIPKPKNIFYSGLVNGSIQLNKRNLVYNGNSNLLIENFSANGNILGNALLNIYPSDKLDNYNLFFKITDNNNDIFKLDGDFKIYKNDFPINFKLTTEKFRIKPFSAIGKNVLQNFNGYFNSEIYLTGTFYNPKIIGSIRTENTSFDVPYLGTSYALKNNPDFKLDNSKIIIKDFIIEDKHLKTFGLMNGEIYHNRLKDWFLNFDIISDNLLAINTTVNTNPIYYGKGMFNGSAKFYGPGKDLDITIKGETNPGTRITVPIKYQEGLADLTFLRFNNSSSNDQLINQGLELSMEMLLNKNALIDIIFDERTGSKITGSGNGTIKISSDYSGLFNLSGDFITDQGEYYFKNFGFVERVFEINKGANITWDGDPYKGILNAVAEYEVPGGANPATLIQNTAFNRKIPTTVKISLQGELSSLSTPTFDLLFPETKGAIKSELDYYLNDYEKKQSQAISLITQGTFIDDYTSSLISSQAITNNLFQRASGIIDEIFTNPDDKMNIGINYSQGDKFAASSLLNRDRLGLTLKSEISDRILINGKIGVPVSGTDENVILGNVQIDFLLNESGSLKARIFNKENEFQFFGDEIGFTQGIGIQYDVEFDNFKELLKKIKKNNKKN